MSAFIEQLKKVKEMSLETFQKGQYFFLLKRIILNQNKRIIGLERQVSKLNRYIDMLMEDSKYVKFDGDWKLDEDEPED